MNQIKKPILTEKTIRLAQELNQYTFEVDLSADKTAASKEIETMFDVEVVDAKTQTRLGKTYAYGKQRQFVGRKPAKKIMIFKLKSGNKIDLFEVK